MATLLYHYLSLLVVFQLALSKAVTTLSSRALGTCELSLPGQPS